MIPECITGKWMIFSKTNSRRETMLTSVWDSLFTMGSGISTSLTIFWARLSLGVTVHLSLGWIDRNHWTKDVVFLKLLVKYFQGIISHESCFLFFDDPCDQDQITIKHPNTDVVFLMIDLRVFEWMVLLEKCDNHIPRRYRLHEGPIERKIGNWFDSLKLWGAFTYLTDKTTSLNPWEQHDTSPEG